MKHIFQKSNNGTGRRLALATLMLTCSASAFSQAPSVPMIDWLELDDSQAEATDFVNVHVGWSHFDLDPVTSVQYRVDGIPVKTRGISEGQFFGKAEIPLHSDGDQELTVALCNTHGCNETAPLVLTTDDHYFGKIGQSRAFSSLTESERERELKRIRANTEMLEHYYPLPESDLSPSPAAFSALIGVVAKGALGGIVKSGSSFAFDSLMNALGLGSNDFGAQIDELQSSIDALSTQVASLTRAIEDLQDETTWQGFLNQHKDANAAVNLIYANFGYVTGWVANGIEVDDFAWTAARQNLADSLTILAGAKLNANGGIADSRDGAIYQLMNAIPQRTATVESYWTMVDEYRDHYRAAMAVAFLGLDLIEDSFDGSGTTRVMADDALLVGQRAVLAMFGYGVAPDLPEGLDFIQLRGSTQGFASSELGVWDGTATIEHEGSWLRNALGQMAVEYRPEHHNGLSMEAFLAEHAVPTSYYLENSGAWKSTGWLVRSLHFPLQGQPAGYRLKPLIGEVRGNHWVENHDHLDVTLPLHYAEAQVVATINERKADIRDAGGYTLTNGETAEAFYSMIDLTDRLNHAGRMADFDPIRVRLAAFGDGAAVMNRGNLPGSDNACLAAQDINLLTAGIYELNWQADGNLVLLEAGALKKEFIWDPARKSPENRLCFEDDGNLVIRNHLPWPVWQSGTTEALGGSRGEQFKLLPDGTMQILNSQSEVIWQITFI